MNKPLLGFAVALAMFHVGFFVQEVLSQEKTPVLPLSSIAAYQPEDDSRFGNVKKTSLSESEQKEAALPTPEVLRCETSERPRNARDFCVNFQIDREIQANEVLLLRFFARTEYARVESGIGLAQVYFERTPARTGRGIPQRPLDRRVEISREWKEYSIPFKANEKLAPGESVLGLALGLQEQVLEIASFRLDSFGTDYDINKIPDNVPRYRGQEADAVWRIEAEKRIEEIRKGNMKIVVRDANDKPIPDAEVQIRMKRHAFRWGTAVVARRFTQQDEDSKKYREIIENNFNSVVFENDLKWYMWDNLRNREQVFRALEWLEARNYSIRGHCLIWPSWRNTPRQLRALENDPEKLKETVRDHILEESTALRGKLIDWDVINEPYDNNDLMKILGNEVMAEWFKLASEGDPEAKLFLNDYGILSAQGLDSRKLTFMENTLKSLIENEAPLGGIGFQSHFSTHVTPPERVLAILDRFAAFKLPIAITEHDLNTTDERFQAEYTRDFLIAAFSHPSVESFFVWGFWERSHWLPNSAYYRSDWSIKPAGQVWIDLVKTKWMTNADETTDGNGEVSLRGFLGEYEITVNKDGKTLTQNLSLTKDGADLRIVLE